MVRIDLAKRSVGIHLSCSVCKDPEFKFNAWMSDHLFGPRGSLTMTRPGDPEEVTIFIDRRHLDNMIDNLVAMRDKIDKLEAEKAAMKQVIAKAAPGSSTLIVV